MAIPRAVLAQCTFIPLASAGYLFISTAAGLRNEHATVYKGDFYSGRGKDIEI